MSRSNHNKGLYTHMAVSRNPGRPCGHQAQTKGRDDLERYRPAGHPPATNPRGLGPFGRARPRARQRHRLRSVPTAGSRARWSRSGSAPRAEMRTPASRAGLPAPEQAPALPMPAHHGVGRDDRQVLVPAGPAPSGEDPQQLVPDAKPSPPSSSSRTRKHRQLVPQEQVPRARDRGAGAPRPGRS